MICCDEAKTRTFSIPTTTRSNFCLQELPCSSIHLGLLDFFAGLDRMAIKARQLSKTLQKKKHHCEKAITATKTHAAKTALKPSSIMCREEQVRKCFKLQEPTNRYGHSHLILNKQRRKSRIMHKAKSGASFYPLATIKTQCCLFLLSSIK